VQNESGTTKDASADRSVGTEPDASSDAPRSDVATSGDASPEINVPPDGRDTGMSPEGGASDTGGEGSNDDAADDGSGPFSDAQPDIVPADSAAADAPEASSPSDATGATDVRDATDAASDRRSDATLPDGRTCDPVEWCDGVDNDCNGVIDDGYVCPDPSVSNTLPFVDGAYFQGTTAEGSCGADALQRVWPTKSNTYYAGFDCYADLFQFRRNDWQLFYQSTFSGIRQDGAPDGGDPIIPTPPCGDGVSGYFGFESDSTLYYQCGTSLRRGNGEAVTGLNRLAGVLDDGRTIVMRSFGSSGSRFEVADKAGQTATVLDVANFVGTMTPQPNATTIRGNDAFVLFSRALGQNPTELVMFRLTPSNQWLLVRRVPSARVGMWPLALSDGTILVRERDPATTFDERIVVFPPGGSETVIWREAEAPVVRAHIGSQLLIGPAVPSGPSVRTE
jgi:hypothetical protein